jgi:Glycosyl hydrolase family 26
MLRGVLVVVVLGAAVLVGSAAGASGVRGGAGFPGRSAAKLVPGSGLLFGAYVNPENVWRGNDDAFAKVEAFESLLGRSLAIDLHYYDWTDVFPSGLEEWDISHGRVPLVSWQGASLDAINGARYDSLVRQRALEIRQLGAPVFLRWGWEMNGNWYAHAGPVNMPDGPRKFVAAWRRIYRIFASVGASNVVWVWCPNASSVPNEGWNSWRKYYPGDAYVDWVGIDGYNWGSTQPGSTWQSLSEIIEPIYRDYASRKPIMVAETASAEAGGDKSAWIRSAGAALVRDFPALKAFVWFEVAKETDWRAESSPAALSAFRSLVGSPYFNAR